MIINLFYLFFICFGFYSFSKILFLKNAKKNNIYEDYLFHSAIGLIITACLILTAGLTNNLTKKNIFLLFILQNICIVANAVKIEKIIKAFLIFFKKNPTKNIIILILLFLNVILHLPGAMSPVVSLDGLTYHLTLPKLYLAAEKIYHIDFLFYSFFPQFSELMFTYGLGLGVPEFAQLYHFYFYLLTLILIIIFSKKIGLNNFYSVFAALCFASSPSINRLAGYIKNEFFLIFFMLYSLYFFIEFAKTKEFKNIFYAIIFAAIANNVKLHGIIHSLIISSIIIIFIFIKKIKIRNALLLLLLLAVVSSPFYIRNYLYIGNPVYPFFGKYFKMKNIINQSNEQTAKLKEQSASMVRHFKENKLTSHPLINALKFPYIVSIKFQTYDFWKYALSPLFFILLCFILILPFFIKQNQWYFIILFYSVSFIYLIYFNAPRSRYILPVFPAISILGIYAINRFKTIFPKIIKFNLILFTGIILINFPLLAAQHIIRYKVLFGLENRENYLIKRMYSEGEFYQAIQWVNKNLKTDDKIFISHQQTFYFDIQFILGYTPNLTLSPVNNIGVTNEMDLLNKLTDNGVTHIFYSHKFAKRFSHNLTELIEKLEYSNKIIPIKKFDNNTVYKIYKF